MRGTRTVKKTACLPAPERARQFMYLALELASRGRGKTSPNPMVGAVVVRDGMIVGMGHHRRFGASHAEVNALDEAGRRARGGTLFVNLEPCCHYGHTPPCVTRIIESGIKNVFVSIVDPDRRVNGKGIRLLRKRGVKVNLGLLKLEARRLNEAYLKWTREKRPFVALKVCQSLDGRIAASDGSSRGLGSQEEIRFVHSLRAGHDAVLVGIDTVLADDPRLDVRKTGGMNPHRIVLDSRLRVPSDSRILVPRKGERVIVAVIRAAVAAGAGRAKAKGLRRKGVELWLLPERNGKVSLGHLLSRAAASSIQSILVEGGSQVITSFLKEKRADKIYVAVAPKLIGGTRSRVWPAEIGVRSVRRALRVKNVSVRSLGTDLLVEGYL